MARTLLNDVLYYRSGSVHSGYLFFDNEKIVDFGEEVRPEYELAELIVSYERRALAMHGYSLAVDVFKYAFKGSYSRELLDTLSTSELERVATAVLYELYSNGVTLPVVQGYRVDVVNRVLGENSLKAVVICEGESFREYRGIRYIFAESNKLLYEDVELGDARELLCSASSITSKCAFLDATSSYTLNVSALMNELVKTHSLSVDSGLLLLTRPYAYLKLDSGEINRGSNSDVVVYDLRNSLKAVPRNEVKNVVLRGYAPDQVFVDGDLFFDRGESLVLAQPRIDDVLFKI